MGGGHFWHLAVSVAAPRWPGEPPWPRRTATGVKSSDLPTITKWPADLNIFLDIELANLPLLQLERMAKEKKSPRTHARTLARIEPYWESILSTYVDPRGMVR